jgi:pimeloyl-ACP methyl ester carboxylesterase
MRVVPGRRISVNGRAVYVEERGQGQDWVVFEAGAGCGRTCWDAVVPLLVDRTSLVTYDRSGRALGGRTTEQPRIDDMADDLVAMAEAVVPARFVLVAHSMGGLVVRRAAERLGPRLRGLMLVDPLPETSPTYDTWTETTKRIDRMLAVTQTLSRFRPFARLFSRNLRGLYASDTYQAMLVEDFTAAGIFQTRKEMQAVAAAISEFRVQPPAFPTCPTIVLSAGRPEKGREVQNALAVEHQRRYADNLPDGRSEVVDSAHLIQAEQPQLLAARIRQLLQETA